MKKTTIFALSTALVLTGSLLCVSSSSFSKVNADAVVNHPNYHAGKKYNENPEPLLKGNVHADKSNFITEENAIGLAKVPDDAKVENAKLKEWGQYIKEDSDGDGTIAGVTASDRMVWVVKVFYPNGVNTRGGYFDNANQIIVIDAETSQMLQISTTGDARPLNRPVGGH